MIKNRMNLKTIFFIIILISLSLPVISYGADVAIGKYQIKNDKYITQIEENIKVKDFKTNIGSNNIKIYENDKEITNVNQLVKTGMKVVIENKEYTAVVKGDSKGTGKTSLTDLISILRHITAQNTERIRNKHPNWILKNENLEAIDFNGDGKIDLTDCISLQKSLLKPKNSNSGNKNTSNTTNNTNTNVTNKTEKEVTKITISKTNAELNIGKILTLTARITPSNATNKSVTWSSSNEKVATVSSGKVTGISEGTTTITVKSSNGMSATCEVKVKPIEVTNVRLSKTIANLYIGDTLELKATINPTTATNKTITWSSDNPKIATVDGNGKVIVVGEGTAAITVKTANGKTATCKITAKKKIIKASTITLDQTSISLTEGQTLKLNATISPENTTDKTITWSSSNEKVATVDNNGNIKAISAGKAVITAKTSNLKTSTTKVTVTSSITGISLNKTSMKILLEDIKTIQLIANITPSTVSEDSKKITWTSSNNNIATVDSKGIVTLKNKGTVTIQAKTINNKTATCNIVVEKYGNETNSSEFLDIAKTLHDYVRKNKYYYPTKSNVAAGKAVQDYAPTILGYKVDFKFPVFGESSKKRYVDCSSYVSWVISAYTGTPIKKKSAALLKNPMNFIKVSVDSKNKNKSLKAGDVIVKNGHTEIYAGSGKSYSCGSTGQIRATKSSTMGDWKYAFRAPKSLEFRLKNLELVNAKDKCVTGETIQIKAKFNGKIYSSKTVAKMTESKVPVLKIRFGNGEIRTITNNSNNVKISSDGKEITYTYKITSQDKGALNLVSYQGTVYNVAGVSKKIENSILSGKLTIANQ